MDINSFSQKFLDFFCIKTIQEPVISKSGVILSKLVFVPVNNDGSPCVDGYLYSPSHLRWLFRHGDHPSVMDGDFSHMIGIQVL